MERQVASTKEKPKARFVEDEQHDTLLLNFDTRALKAEEAWVLWGGQRPACRREKKRSLRRGEEIHKTRNKRSMLLTEGGKRRDAQGSWSAWLG